MEVLTIQDTLSTGLVLHDLLDQIDGLPVVDVVLLVLEKGTHLDLAASHFGRKLLESLLADILDALLLFGLDHVLLCGGAQRFKGLLHPVPLCVVHA